MKGLIIFLIFYFLGFATIFFIMSITAKGSDTYGNMKKSLKLILPSFIEFHILLIDRLKELVKIIKRR